MMVQALPTTASLFWFYYSLAHYFHDALDPPAELSHSFALNFDFIPFYNLIHCAAKLAVPHELVAMNYPLLNS